MARWRGAAPGKESARCSYRWPSCPHYLTPLQAVWDAVATRSAPPLLTFVEEVGFPDVDTDESHELELGQPLPGGMDVH